MRTTHRIIIGDSRWMKEVTDESVHLIVTSPPYWQLKEILKIGYEFILLFKKYGSPPKVNKEVKEKSILTLDEWNYQI